MNRTLKQALMDAFRAPPPVRKAAFLKQHHRRELSRWKVIAIQVRYIPWWIWALSLVLSAFILVSTAHSEKLRYAAALTPFLALLVLTENGRSRRYLMEELELACRMSRQSTMLARMVALGLFHLLLLGAQTMPLAVWGEVSTARAGVYLLTPYLLTAALGMELTRRIRGREGLLACGAAAVLTSGLGMAVPNQNPTLYQPEYLPLWTAVLAAAILAVAVELICNIKKMEEWQWN